eukprot:TRINITY_DN57615_c0_g1_i1.p1 TRINITY_DN57615_c0_g1~~TRINITY_DN57615_c0_g1_i1.p1  ORF type:complete len:612 (+),score=109.33 TRINITY_DN57615_c0_g1_i1:52-1836(+)
MPNFSLPYSRGLTQETLRDELERFASEILFPKVTAISDQCCEELSRVVREEVSSLKSKQPARGKHGMQRSSSHGSGNGTGSISLDLLSSMGKPRETQPSSRALMLSDRTCYDAGATVSTKSIAFHPIPQGEASGTSSDSDAPSTSRGHASGFSVSARKSWELEQEDEPLEGIDVADSVLAQLLHHPYFSLLVALLVILNTFLQGVQVDYAARHWQDGAAGMYGQTVFHWMDVTFCTAFSLELLLRFVVHGRAVLTLPDRKWTMFDCFVVGTQIVELTLPNFFHGHHINLTFMRSFRLLRMLRVLRAARAVNAVAELRMMVITILGSLRSLVWVMLILLLTTYTFSVYLTQMVADHWSHQPENHDHELLLAELYGNVPDTMLSLFQIMTGGLDWHDALEPLRKDVSPLLIPCFVVWVSFATFALLNVITGLFLNAAQRTAEDDKKRLMVDQMRRNFEQCDTDGSGGVSLEELERHLRDADFVMYLKAIDLHEDHARELFSLLDVNGTGEVMMDDFVNGAIRFHGAVQAIDFAVFLREFKRQHEEQFAKIAELAVDFQAHREVVAGAEQRMRETMRRSIQVFSAKFSQQDLDFDED